MLSKSLLLTQYIWMQVVGNFVTLYNSSIIQSQDFNQFAVNIGNFITDPNIKIHVELEQLDSENRNYVPILFYFPGSFPQDVKVLRSQWTSQASKINAPYFYDYEGAFQQKNKQYLSISKDSFPDEYRWRYNHFLLSSPVNSTLNIGVLSLLPMNQSSFNYHLTVRLFLSDDNNIFDCPSGCNNQGTCSYQFKLCSCYANYFNVDCSDNMSPQSYNQYYNLTIQPNSWQYKVSDLDELSNADSTSLQVDVNSLIGMVQFTYGCLNGDDMLPNMQNYNQPFVQIQQNQDELVILHYHENDIQNCQQRTKDLSQLLGIVLKSYLILAFYNSHTTVSQATILVSLTQQQGYTFNIVAIYISSAIFVGISLMLTLIIVRRRINARPVSRVINLQDPVITRVERRQKNNQVAYNKYMPLISYKKVLEEYPDLKEITECLICLIQFEMEDFIRTTSCFHIFHQKCIDEWLKIHQSCPVCRADLNKKALKQAMDLYSDPKEPVKFAQLGSNRQSLENQVNRLEDGQIPQSSRTQITGNQYIQRIRDGSSKAQLQRSQSNSIAYNTINVISKEQSPQILSPSNNSALMINVQTDLINSLQNIHSQQNLFKKKSPSIQVLNIDHAKAYERSPNRNMSIRLFTNNGGSDSKIVDFSEIDQFQGPSSKEFIQFQDPSSQEVIQFQDQSSKEINQNSRQSNQFQKSVLISNFRETYGERKDILQRPKRRNTVQEDTKGLAKRPSKIQFYKSPLSQIKEPEAHEKF